MTLHLVRGPSGCGKSTFAEKLRDEIIFTMGIELILNPVIHSTDDWFTTKDGEYKFDKRFLSRAHTETTTRVMEDLFLGKDVIVANTFINYWEIAPYIWLAKLAGVDCVVYEPDVVFCPEASITVQHNDESLLTYKMYERCVHGVPPDTIQSHIDNFHKLEANQLIKEVTRYTTGLLE